MMINRRLLSRILLMIMLMLILLAPALDGRANDANEANARFFETKIRPVLANACYECHSKKTGKNEGGLTLDTKVGLRQGGNSGPGITANRLDESWVWKLITHADEDARMPPGSTLPNRVLADFRTWIEMGAPDPRDDGLPTVVESSIDIRKGREFWSFQKPLKTPPPIIADSRWSGAIVDRFVRAKLDSAGMQPSPPALASTLLRRLHFDLIGLPPSPADLTRFQAAWNRDSQRAIETEVDRLLESEHFGERWGRHWLDVARYAESNGKQSNQAFPQAWKYRDYVIDSFNEDKPFDRFLREQIAGDLLPSKSDAERREGIIATGFLAIGPKPLREKSARQFTMDMVDEQIDATSQAFLGLTVACTRCHDHKTDPIPTQDYYALAGIFLSSDTRYGTFGGGRNVNRGQLIVLPTVSDARVRLTSREIAETKQRLAELAAQLRSFRDAKRAKLANKEETQETTTAGKGKQKRRSPKRARDEQNRLEAKLNSADHRGLVREYGMGMLDRQAPINANVLIRGEVDRPAQRTPRGFLQVLPHQPQRIAAASSGRREMADWLSSKHNPLTARVYVNRVWDKLFGRGLVSTTNNFGKTGMAPTHPELLDYLAVQFMEDGWSTKSLIRSLVLTRTYQASASFNAANYERDPTNSLLWRAAPRRLDAEAIRDAMLAVTGQLDRQRPQGSRVHELGDYELGRKGSPNLTADAPPVRSIYLPAVRDHLPELIQLFDGPDSNVVIGHRETSNVAGQALYLMNNPFVIEQSDAFARKLQNNRGTTTDQVRQAFLEAWGRRPTAKELQATRQFIQRFVPAAQRETGSRSEAERMCLAAICQGLLTSAEFRYLN